VHSSGVSVVVGGSLKDPSKIKGSTMDPVVVCVLEAPGDCPPKSVQTHHEERE
jgi:hypothetical protein